MEQIIKNFVRNNKAQLLVDLKEMCHIPAPSHMEDERARYCLQKFKQYGLRDAYIDSALNVICPINCEDSDDITVLVAHTDTVFPDTEPMPYFDDGAKIHCPGCADDTASVAVLLMIAKFFAEHDICPEHGMMFVANSCEEGLGNLKGTRRIFEDYKGRIGRFISLDSSLGVVADRCVGSHRYEVEVTTTGGHSFGNFGNENAINVLSGIVRDIYSIQVPEKHGTVTTYNVGTISGGTSVNTIAQSASMLCEYRSDDAQCLSIMQERFEHIFASAVSEGVTVNVSRVGDRPCGITSDELIDDLKEKLLPIVERFSDTSVSCVCMSTDCNIPLSLGIPALCIGVNTHGGIHTREEWVDKESVITGLELGLNAALAFVADV